MANLATHLLRGVIERDFDPTYSQDAVLGHTLLRGRAFALGQAIGEALAERPERVAVIASGGMSHFPGTARYEQPNFAFDEWVVTEIAHGRYDDLLALSPVNLNEVGEAN